MTVLSQDLSKMPYGQLKSLRSQVDAAMSARQRETAAKIASIADETDIALDQLKSLSTSDSAPAVRANGNGTHAPRKPTAQAAKPKAKKGVVHKPGTVQFRNPEDPKQVWTGRGPKPQWMQAKLAAGVTIDSLRV
jgi:DNA-binding protein H-NS